jgi:type II secretory pathway pseudopilin PulG
LIRRLRAERGYSVIELLIVMMILGTVIGGLVAVFARAINAESDQNRRFQAQQDSRLALDKLRSEIHGGCTVANPSAYNTPVSSVTVYMGSDLCVAGTSTVTWCTVASNGQYALYRILSTSCTGATQKVAQNLTSANIFTYLPPNSHVTTLNGGAGGIVTADGSSTLARLHVDLTVNPSAAKVRKPFRLLDDIVMRNAPRACATGVASC